MTDSTDIIMTDREHSAATNLQPSVEQLAARQQRIDELVTRGVGSGIEPVPVTVLRAVRSDIGRSPARMTVVSETVQAVDQGVSANV